MRRRQPGHSAMFPGSYSRHDSALSLALERQLSLHTPTNPHVSSSSQPWSSYNVRDYLSTKGSTDETHASLYFREEDFPSELRISSPERSPHPATALTGSKISDHATPGAISCAQCGTTFTGTYRRSNLSRHVRHKHGQASGKLFLCRASQCVREFRRQDARLKHERKLHPELNHAPVESQHHATSSAVSSHQLDSRGGLICLANKEPYNLDERQDVVLSPAQNLPTEAPISDKMLAAWRVFTQLHATLDEIEYSHACDTLFTRWEAIAQELKDQRSDAYDVFARALDDMHSIIFAIDCTLTIDHLEDIRNHSKYSRQHRPYQETTQSVNGQVSHSGSAPSANRDNNLRSRAGDFTDSVSGKSSTTERKGKKQERLVPKVDCPMHKHWLSHRNWRHSAPCNGCSAASMNQVRRHIKDRHLGGGLYMLPYFHYCTRCKGNFVDFASGENHKAAQTCAHTPQLRRNITTSWVQLYRAIFPTATRIPRPFTDQSGFLPDSPIAPPRSPRSFLDRRSSRLAPDPPHQQRDNFAAAEQPIYDALIDTMQLDASSYLPPGASQADPNINSGLFGLEEPVGPEQASYQYRLDNAQSCLLYLLSNAPRYMSAEDMDPVLHSLQHMVDIVRAFYATLRTHPASTVDTHVGGVFSDVTASSETSQAALSNALPDGTQAFSGYDHAPNGVAGSDEAHAMGSDQNCLSHVYDPPVFDPEADGGDVEFYRYLNL